MYVWQLWNRKTYARAFVVAETREKAKTVRPDGAIWSDSRERWRLPLTWVKGGIGRGDYRETPTSQTLEGWPDTPAEVFADRFARCECNYGSFGEVLSTNLSAELRPPEDEDGLREIG